MRKHKQLKVSRSRRTFSFTSPDAPRRVSLVGDFNNWDPKKHPMRDKGEGLWQKAVLLEPGTYEYKFWVDGEWEIDENSENRCPNKFGTLNNFITILPWQQ